MDDDPLVERLRDLGRQPVEPATASRHLTAMAAIASGRQRLRNRLKVGAAFAIGLLIGGTGLASAGALPTPAQDAAHSMLSKVGVQVPHGTERYNDPAVCGVDPVTQKPFRNHGQYVKAHRGDPAAARSRCGKPLKAGTDPDEPKPEGPAGPPADPGAGKGGNGKGNGNRGGKIKPDKDRGVKDEPAEQPAPTTVAPPPPTTTTVAPTTTSSSTTTTVTAPT